MFRSARWQTNSALLVRDRHALLCDPSWTPAEIAAIGGQVARSGADGVSIVVTHADEDHVCGVGAFSNAEVIAGVATAASITSGAAACRLSSASVEWGLRWAGEPFVTRVVDPGAFDVGPFRLEALEASGHALDGTAWLVAQEGLLLPGDYLSGVSPPLVLGSVRRFQDTLVRFIAVLERGIVETVVPGHGPVLTAIEALTVARADAAYLATITRAAGRAIDASAAPGDALVETWAAAELPRYAISDLAIYDPRTRNARCAVEEALAARQEGSA